MRLEIELSNSTPMLIGWYDPNVVDYMGLRPTEVKGIWRWWARAFMGGVLYDKGYLRGDAARDVLRKPSTRETRLVSKLVGVNLGLGFAGEEKLSRASRFKVYAEVRGGVKVVSSSSLGAWSRAQRLRLLAIKKAVNAVAPGHTFTLHVELVENFKHATTALKILIASLQLTGFGKGSRKGLGSLDITLIRGDPGLVDKLGRYMKSPEGLRNLITEIYRECEEIVESEFRGVEVAPSKTGEVEALPPFPVVSRRNVLGVPVTSIRVYRNVGHSLFPSVHNFFVRSERCRVLYGSPVCNDQLWMNRNAWFLGLPRTQKGTGYVIRGDVSRRASPIHLTLHTDRNALGQGAFVSTFLSGDWPRTITWYGGGGGRVNIDVTDQRVVDAYRDFEAEFEDYMKKINAGPGVAVWP